MTRPLIALLGRKDEPTDAVEEYCRYLGAALQPHNFDLQIRRVPWEKHGWSESLRALRLQAAAWRDTWILVQYTALAWSARGFPARFLRVLKILKSVNARVAVVFHDVEPYPGARPIDCIRRAAQIHTMRHAIAVADCAVFTVPLEKVTWLAGSPRNAVYIAVGASLPIVSFDRTPRSELPTIGVFGITGGPPGEEETRAIIAAVRYAAEKLGRLRLSVFGRHAELREPALRQGLQNAPVELSVEGVLEPEEVIQRLTACDVLLFIRGPISSRRGSAIAGIACGLPVIAYAGSETAPPVTDAGVILTPPGQANQLHAALVRVLSDANYRADLSARSRAIYQSHFSWTAIAARFAECLKE